MQARFYRALYRIRRVEEEIAAVYPSDKIKSPVHLSIGQEAISVGVCEALRPDDVVFGSYRSHALYLAKGGNLRQMIAELYGKADGCAKGKGGSMHLIDTRARVMGASAVVGTTIPQAVGFAYAVKLQRKDSVVASFFGDGAVDEGVFYESLNFAALKALPIVFVCENNRYAIHTHQSKRQKLDNICERARGQGMPAEQIPNNDVQRIYECISQSVGQLRAGSSGPFFFECLTYRLKEHVGPSDDFQLGYRTREEAEIWLRTDPIGQLRAHLDPAERRRIEAEVEVEIEDAFAFAEQSPWPAAAELYTDVYDQ
jgi:TPP-dependent pyruvate/acetoin dehydrogenase alpha subunit